MFKKSRVPLAKYEAERIALIKPSALGDVVHCLPLLSAVRKRFPRAHLAWIVNSSYAPLLEGHPDLDAIIKFDRGAMRQGAWQGMSRMGRFLKQLRAEKFDLVLDMQGLLRSGIMCWASGASRRVGLAGSREGSRFAYTDIVPVPHAANLHAVDRYGLAARALGCEISGAFHVPLAPNARQAAAQFLIGQARPWLMFGVGARWTTKRWPPRHFAELANRAQKLTGGTAIFVGGPEDCATRSCDDFLDRRPLSRFDRQDDAGGAGSGARARRCDDRQRHRPFASRCRFRAAGRGALYLYSGEANRSLRRL